MANTIGTAYIQIEPSTKGISGSISDALDKEASSAGESAGNRLSSALGNAAKIGVSAIAGATTAVVAFGKASVDAGTDFDSSMSQVAATMGFSVEELNTSGSKAQQTFQALRDYAQEMGSTTAFSATESADALNYMALAGYDADTAMEMLPNVLNLAAAGGIDLADASDMVTDAQSALGLSLDDTKVMVDQMAAASSKSNTSVAQLGDAFLTIGANAKNLSGGTQELSTALGLLADNGIKGSEGGTHLRNILLAMNPTTEAAANAWTQLGVNAYDANGNLRPLQDTFLDLSKAMEGMTSEEKTRTISAMFNKTDLASVNALLGTSAERWNELSGAIGDSTDAAENMANVQLDNLEGDVTLFKSALEGAEITISDALTPTLREFTQFGSESLSTLTEAFKEGGLTGAMDALGEILSDGLEMVVKKAPEMVEAGMELLEAVGEGMMDNLDEIIEATVEIITTISENLIDHLPDLVEAAIEIIVKLADYIADALPEMIPTIVDIIVTICETLLDHLDELVDAALKIIVALTEGLIAALPELVEKAPEIIVRLIETLTDEMPKIVETGAELIVQLAVGLIEAIPDLVRKIPEIVEAILNGLKEAWEDFKEAGKNIVDGIWEGIRENWEELKNSVTEAAGELVDRVKNFFNIGSPSKLMRDEIGQWIPKGIAVGIEANTDSVTDAMDDMSSDALTASKQLVSDYSMQYSGLESATSSDSTVERILYLMQYYMPNMATNDKLNNLNFNVNKREFARLVNEV